MIATRQGNTAVHKGDKLAGMRVIPLVIAEEKLRKAEEAAGDHAPADSPALWERRPPPSSPPAAR